MSPEDRWFPSHLREIARSECLDLLASHQVGRVAYWHNDTDRAPVVTAAVQDPQEAEPLLRLAFE